MRLAVFLFINIITLGSLAQETSAQKPIAKESDAEEFAAKGVRVGVLRHSLQGTATVSLGKFSTTTSAKLDDTVGFSLGYAYLPIKRAGVVSDLTLTTLSQKDLSISASLTRISNSLVFTPSHETNFKIGWNLSSANNSKFEFGFQVGVGVHLTKKMGLDVGYVTMNQSFVPTGAGKAYFSSATESGLEIGLNVTSGSSHP